jgi:tRNA(Ile)-lysidine synthase
VIIIKANNLSIFIEFHAIIEFVTTLSHLSHILQQDCQLVSTRPVLIGVSGGPDSLCLLDIMWRLGYPLLVAHLNHGLRDEADKDAMAVRGVAHARGLPFILEQADIAAYARGHAFSIEEAARMVRYQFLFEQARQHQAQAVAVAHTADDQVETILMHLLRGTGISGLKGMSYRMHPTPWSHEIALVRPLLGIFRDEVLSYCNEQNLHPVFDRSNLDTTFYRNRIRGELIPTLEKYNSGIKSNMLRMAQTLASDDHVLEVLTNEVWQDCCLEHVATGVALTINILSAQPLGIQRRLVRRAISILRPGLRDIDFSAVERTLLFLKEPTRSEQLDLTNGLRLLREGEKLWIASWEGDLPTGAWPQIDHTPHQLTIPGCIDLHGKWHLRATYVEDIQKAIAQAADNADPFQAWIDIRNPLPSLLIRPPIPGDRFQPLGMNGHRVKLSDFFVNIKMPRRVRKNWPLVCLGNDIVWIPGYRISHLHRLTVSSTQAMFLQLFKD